MFGTVVTGGMKRLDWSVVSIVDIVAIAVVVSDAVLGSVFRVLM